MRLGGLRERIRQILMRTTSLQGLQLQSVVDQLVAEVFSDASLQELAPVTASSLGRNGGLKGGPAAAESLGPQGRIDRAKKAAKARWEKRDAV